jgi:hypothetical protein
MSQADPHRGDRPDGASISRREMLRRSGMGLGLLGLAGLVDSGAVKVTGAATSVAGGNPMAARAPQFTAKARHVIHIFANGGPSHVDTFDPKPSLAKYAGQMLPTENLRTERKTGRVSYAVQVSEVWPERHSGERVVRAHG